MAKPLPEMEDSGKQGPREDFFARIGDYILEKEAPPPEQFLPDPDHIVVLDQGAEASSVAMALASFINLLRWERGHRDLVSPRMLHQMSKLEDGVPEGTGTWVWSAFLGWEKNGVCLEQVWPWRPGRPGSPSESPPGVAEDARPKSLLRVRPDPDLLKSAIQRHHGAVAEVWIHEGWLGVRPGEARIEASDGKSSTQRKLHAVAVIGYTSEGFLIQNSWGSGWGGIRIGEAEFPGCAIWTYRDFEQNVSDHIWTATIEGEPLPTGRPRVQINRAGFRSDSVGGIDRLGIGREVESLAMVIGSRDVEPPLAVGLFGDWGVGKSFFIKEIRKSLEQLADEAAGIEKKRGQEGVVEPAFWSDIAQIDFNAWHFQDQNFWASFVVRIFDGLAEHLDRKEKKGVDLVRQAIFQRIEAKSEEVKSLEEELGWLQVAIDEKGTEIDGLDREIADTVAKLSEMDLSGLAVKRWGELLKTNETLRQAVADLGLPEALTTYDELKGQLRQARSTSGKFRSRITALTSEGNPVLRIALLVGILAGGLAIGYVVDWLVGSEGIQKLAGEVSRWVSWLAGIGGSAVGLLKNVNVRLAEVDKAWDEVVKDETTAERDARTEKSEELAGLEERRSAAENELVASKKEIDDLEAQLTELRVGRRLFHFIRDKAESSQYREKLGIIASVRDDLQALTELLTECSAEKRKRWQPGGESPEEEDRDASPDDVASIDRIVLYIDDLDRCQPERVVEILQAVHLLLAFELFVVVVAVDSRWLLRSLEKEYPEFLTVDRHANGRGEITRWSSTPQNYLEKIFQVALTVRPMSEGGYLRLLDDLVPASVDVGEVTIDDDEPPPDGAGEGLVLARKPEGVPDGKPREVAGKVDPNPPSLAITEDEILSMRGLHGFLGTPRALKRFVNTYRLIRASLSPIELSEYEGKESADPPAVLLLLALLTGTPLEATWVFRALDAADDGDKWTDFVAGLVLKDRAQPADSPFENSICPDISELAAPRWRRIHRVLTAAATRDFGTLVPVRKWVRRVARYAFHPFHFERLSALEDEQEEED